MVAKQSEGQTFTNLAINCPEKTIKKDRCTFEYERTMVLCNVLLAEIYMALHYSPRKLGIQIHDVPMLA